MEKDKKNNDMSRPKDIEGDLPFFKLSMDKRVFRTDDETINCVFQFSNVLLDDYDSLDILVVVKYKI